MEEVDLHGAHAKDHCDNNLPPSWHPQLPQYRHRKRDHNDVQNEIDDRGNQRKSSHVHACAVENGLVPLIYNRGAKQKARNYDASPIADCESHHAINDITEVFGGDDAEV